MFSEYDVVIAKVSLNPEVPAGASGTILYIYEAIPPEYEVEFMNSNGDSLAVLTVKQSDLELAKI